MSNSISAPTIVDTPLAPTDRRVSTTVLTARFLSQLELGIAAVVTLLVVSLHVAFCQHVGGLWRDEVNSINLATIHSWVELWDNLQFDSFPVLYFAVLRGWAAFFGLADASLRTLGLLMGLGGVGALWLNARGFGLRAPVLSMVLLGCNPLYVRYSDSNRAYGLGILLILLTLAAVWRVVAAPRPGRVAWAMLLAVLSVQTIYYNSVLLFAICLAGAVAAAAERRWKTAVCVLSIGVPAALSLLIYVGTIHRLHQWSDIVATSVTLGWLWEKLSELTGSGDSLEIWIWPALIAGALGLAGWTWWRPVLAEPRVRGEEANAGGGVHRSVRRVTVFAATLLVVTVVSYAWFLKALGYSTQPWYYIALLAVVAVGLDALFGRTLAAAGGSYGRLAVCVGACGLAALTFAPAQESVFLRQTNLDLKATQLEELANEQDLIVCTHWETAITLAYYYHGRAALVTVPPVEDHRLHRYDLVRTQLMRPDAAAPTLARMAATLRTGHRVWLSGPLIVPADGQAPVPLPPARVVNGQWPDSQFYYWSYAEQACYLLQQHAVSAFRVPPTSRQPVCNYEAAQLTGFQGWR